MRQGLALGDGLPRSRRPHPPQPRGGRVKLDLEQADVDAARGSGKAAIANAWGG